MGYRGGPDGFGIRARGRRRGGGEDGPAGAGTSAHFIGKSDIRLRLNGAAERDFLVWCECEELPGLMSQGRIVVEQTQGIRSRLSY
jgi:hypothetical protein